jgi:hypothetical protein
MTPAQAQAHRTSKATPTTFSGSDSQQRLQSAAEAHFKARQEKDSRLTDASETGYAALRSAFSAIPGVSEALTKLTPLPEVQLPPLPPAPLAKPTIVTASHVKATPPFGHQTGEKISDSIGDIREYADQNGSLTVAIKTSPTRSGSATCWAAVGQAFTVSKGRVQFLAAPSFNWSAQWSSRWWWLAAGNVWIGQVVNRRRLDGSFVDQPVNTQNILYQFKDNNLDDNGDKSGSSSASLMQSLFDVDASYILECFVWIGADAENANGGLSSAHDYVIASVPWLEVDVF